MYCNFRCLRLVPLERKCGVGEAMDSQTFLFLFGWFLGVLTGVTFGLAERIKKNH